MAKSKTKWYMYDFDDEIFHQFDTEQELADHLIDNCRNFTTVIIIKGREYSFELDCTLQLAD